MEYFIDVILPIPVVKLFTYQVNEDEARFLKPGMRVAVPFGKPKCIRFGSFDTYQTTSCISGKGN